MGIHEKLHARATGMVALPWDPRDEATRTEESPAADWLKDPDSWFIKSDLVLRDDNPHPLSINIDEGARLVAEFFGEKAAAQWRAAVLEKANVA